MQQILIHHKASFTMITKMRNMGVRLTPKEMKSIKGGGPGGNGCPAGTNPVCVITDPAGGHTLGNGDCCPYVKLTAGYSCTTICI